MSTEDAVTAAEELADVLTRENAALHGMDVSAAAALVATKQAAIAALAAFPPVQATPRLAAVGQRLRVLAAENQALLERAIKVQARVMEIVAGAYRPPAGSLRYGRDGEPATPPMAGMALSRRA